MATTARCEKFQLPPDYYKRVHPFITALVICFAWILFPVLVLRPSLLSPLVDDWLIKIVVGYHSNLLKFLQIHIWVKLKHFLSHCLFQNEFSNNTWSVFCNVNSETQLIYNIEISSSKLIIRNFLHAGYWTTKKLRQFSCDVNHLSVIEIVLKYPCFPAWIYNKLYS